MKDVGISVYVDNNDKSIREFYWLYRSWEYSGSPDMSEIILFHNPKIPINLLPEREDVICIPLAPISETAAEWSYYPHINATWYLTTSVASYLNEYKYLLRTDNDVFLTKNFPNMRPRLATFGTSVYASNPEVANNLTRISEKWGIKQHFINIGNTVMAKSQTVLDFSIRQFEYAKRLKDEEFHNGVGVWGGWYLYVLNMYAGCLAANATYGNNMLLGGIDVFCQSTDPINTTDYHIHAWQTNQYFSKLEWEKGTYNDVDFNKLDTNIIADYCLYIAGKRGVA